MKFHEISTSKIRFHEIPKLNRTYYGAYRMRTYFAGVNGDACARVNASALVPLHDNVQKCVYLQVRVLHENVRMRKMQVQR